MPVSLLPHSPHVVHRLAPRRREIVDSESDVRETPFTAREITVEREFRAEQREPLLPGLEQQDVAPASLPSVPYAVSTRPEPARSLDRLHLRPSDVGDSRRVSNSVSAQHQTGCSPSPAAAGSTPRDPSNHSKAPITQHATHVPGLRSRRGESGIARRGAPSIVQRGPRDMGSFRKVLQTHFPWKQHISHHIGDPPVEGGGDDCVVIFHVSSQSVSVPDPNWPLQFGG